MINSETIAYFMGLSRFFKNIVKQKTSIRIFDETIKTGNLTGTPFNKSIMWS